MRWTAVFVLFRVVLKGRLREKQADLLSSLLTLSFSFALLLLPIEAKPITFDDGTVHVINAANSLPLETVTAEDGPGMTTTTLNLIVGGEIGTISGDDLILNENSLLNMSGGEIGRGLFVNDSSVANISGGSVPQGPGVVAGGTSTVVFSGGTAQQASSGDNSAFTLSGAVLQFMNAQESGMVTMSAGQITNRFSQAARLTPSLCKQRHG